LLGLQDVLRATVLHVLRLFDVDEGVLLVRFAVTSLLELRLGGLGLRRVGPRESAIISSLT
jgi:hypothetical protein